MKLQINIETIPHDQHRYETVGDWFYDKDGVLQIRVSDMGNEDFELVIALHELIETTLCKRANITEASVDAFDKSYKGEAEPGDEPTAPYHKQHTTASICERAIAQCLGINWNEYDRVINEL